MITSHTLTYTKLFAAMHAVASAQGVQVHPVGGFVRDLVRFESTRVGGVPLHDGANLTNTLRALDAVGDLSLHVGKDIDTVIVNGDAVKFLSALATHLSWSDPVIFERFGTGQIRGDGFIVEAVIARSESYDRSSRKPTVREATLEEDIARRDFTINTLYMDFDGTLHDYIGSGIEDLKNGVLQTPRDPGLTFTEDPLRMVRAARFCGQLSVRPTPALIAALRNNAQRLAIVSIERITTEIRLLLLTTHPSSGFKVLQDGGLLPILYPELSATIGVEQGGWHDDDVWNHTLRTVDFTPPNLITRMSALLHDVGKPPTHVVQPDGKHTFYQHPSVGAAMATQILTRQRWSSEEIHNVGHLVALHLRPIQYTDMAFSDAAVRRIIRDAGTLRQQMMDLAKADTLASTYPTVAELDALALRMEQLDAAGSLATLHTSLTGEDLMEIAHKGPGRWIHYVKIALEEAILDGDIPLNNANAERQWLLTHMQVFDEDFPSK